MEHKWIVKRARSSIGSSSDGDTQQHSREGRAQERRASLTLNIGHLVTRNYMRYTISHDSRLQTQGLGEVLLYWVEVRYPGATR